MPSLRLAYVEGATPGKWIRAWGERMPTPIEAWQVAEEEQEAVLHSREADAAIVRMPIDTTGLHVVRLYEERRVVVAAKDHAVAAFSELTLADIAGEPQVTGLAWRDAIAVAASGAALATMPQSIARLHHRRDVSAVLLEDAPTTQVALAWRQDRDGDDIQTLVGIVRGRTARSSR